MSLLMPVLLALALSWHRETKPLITLILLPICKQGLDPSWTEVLLDGKRGSCFCLELWILPSVSLWCNMITDHKPLELIFNNPKSKPRAWIEWWALRLQPDKYKIIYKAGKTNVADDMSRHPQQLHKTSITHDVDTSILSPPTQSLKPWHWRKKRLQQQRTAFFSASSTRHQHRPHWSMAQTLW